LRGSIQRLNSLFLGHAIHFNNDFGRFAFLHGLPLAEFLYIVTMLIVLEKN